MLARTERHHSFEPWFRSARPVALGLVRLDAGPVARCFLGADRTAGDAVQVRARLDATGHPVLDAT